MSKVSFECAFFIEQWGSTSVILGERTVINNDCLLLFFPSGDVTFTLNSLISDSEVFVKKSISLG